MPPQPKSVNFSLHFKIWGGICHTCTTFSLGRDDCKYHISGGIWSQFCVLTWRFVQGWGSMFEAEGINAFWLTHASSKAPFRFLICGAGFVFTLVGCLIFQVRQQMVTRRRESCQMISTMTLQILSPSHLLVRGCPLVCWHYSILCTFDFMFLSCCKNVQFVRECYPVLL